MAAISANQGGWLWLIAVPAVVLLFFVVRLLVRKFVYWRVGKGWQKMLVELKQVAADRHATKRAFLQEKYEDERIVEDLMERRLWVGESAGQVVDSLGPPHRPAAGTSRSESHETWKYCETSSGFLLEVRLEDGFVSSWSGHWW